MILWHFLFPRFCNAIEKSFAGVKARTRLSLQRVTFWQKGFLFNRLVSFFKIWPTYRVIGYNDNCTG
jgi:hypothetical protein